MTSTSFFTKFFDNETWGVDKVISLAILAILAISTLNFSLLFPTGSGKRAYMKTTAQGVGK